MVAWFHWRLVRLYRGGRRVRAPIRRPPGDWQDSVRDPAMGMTAVEDSVLSESATTVGSLLGEVSVPEASRQR